MQSLPDDVFQELQQQRTSQGQAKARQDRSSYPERGAGVPGGRQESKASLPLASEDSTYARGSPPSTSFFGSAFGASLRPAGQETSGRGYGAQGQAQSATPAGVAARVRSRVGSRTPGAAPWTPTAETVPSQLVGGRVGTDADVLTIDFSTNTASKFHDGTASRERLTFDRGPSLLSPSSLLRYVEVTAHNLFWLTKVVQSRRRPISGIYSATRSVSAADAYHANITGLISFNTIVVFEEIVCQQFRSSAPQPQRR